MWTGAAGVGSPVHGGPGHRAGPARGEGGARPWQRAMASRGELTAAARKGAASHVEGMGEVGASRRTRRRAHLGGCGGTTTSPTVGLTAAAGLTSAARISAKTSGH